MRFFRFFILLIINILPLTILSYFTYDNIETISRLEKSKAIVKTCFIKTSSTGKAISHHVPKAYTNDGELVEGSIGQPKFLLTCKEMIGKTVEVYIDRNNQKNNRISTYWQMWFLPSLFFILNIAWYLIVFKKLRMKYKKA